MFEQSLINAGYSFVKKMI